jgi:hypothetical protein
MNAETPMLHSKARGLKIPRGFRLSAHGLRRFAAFRRYPGWQNPIFSPTLKAVASNQSGSGVPPLPSALPPFWKLEAQACPTSPSITLFIQPTKHVKPPCLRDGAPGPDGARKTTRQTGHSHNRGALFSVLYFPRILRIPRSDHSASMRPFEANLGLT